MNGSKNKVSLAWLGQMGLRINVNETTILVDYFASVYPERRTIPPIAAEAVRGVDAFLGTHDHLDHIDHSAWRIWASTCPDARFVFPSTHRQSVLNDGIPTKRMLPIDAGQHVQVGDIIIPSACNSVIDTTSEQTVSQSIKALRSAYPQYATVVDISRQYYGTKPDIVIEAR